MNGRVKGFKSSLKDRLGCRQRRRILQGLTVWTGMGHRLRPGERHRDPLDSAMVVRVVNARPRIDGMMRFEMTMDGVGVMTVMDDRTVDVLGRQYCQPKQAGDAEQCGNPGQNATQHDKELSVALED